MSNPAIQRIEDQIVKSPEDKREYRGLELANGIKVLLISDPTTDKSSAALDVHIGTVSLLGDDPVAAAFDRRCHVHKDPIVITFMFFLILSLYNFCCLFWFCFWDRISLCSLGNLKFTVLPPLASNLLCSSCLSSAGVTDISHHACLW